MASTSVSYNDGKPLRVTGYSAIPMTNMQSPDMHMMNNDRPGLLNRMVPRRTLVIAVLLLTISCGLIGRLSVKWDVKQSYNRAMRTFSGNTDSFPVSSVPVGVQNMRTNTGPSRFGQPSSLGNAEFLTGSSSVQRTGMFQNPPVGTSLQTVEQVSRTGDGEYLTKPSNVKNVYRSDGMRMVVSMFTVPAEPIRQGMSIKAAGICSAAEPVNSCVCTVAAPSCLVARTGKVDKVLNRCLCEYRGISSDCGRIMPSVLAIASCSRA